MCQHLLPCPNRLAQINVYIRPRNGSTQDCVVIALETICLAKKKRMSGSGLLSGRVMDKAFLGALLPWQAILCMTHP